MSYFYKDERELPLIIMRGIVAFPDLKIHFDVGRKQSVSAVEYALKNGSEVFLVAQKDISEDQPGEDGIYKTGVTAQINQIIKGRGKYQIHISVTGICRAKLIEITKNNPFYVAKIAEICEETVSEENEKYAKALVRHAKDAFASYLNVSTPLSPSIGTRIIAEKDPGKLADFVAGNIIIEYEERQTILDIYDSLDRLSALIEMVYNEADLLSIEEDIAAKIQANVDRNQREYYLQEQLKVLSDELNGYDSVNEIEEYKKRINSLKADEEIKEKLLKECSRLAKLSSNSPESSVSRDYIEQCLSLPWGIYSKEQTNIVKSEKILENDHYGLKKVKERILDYIAVASIAPDIKSQIICLVGPPGVGKTSIARSLAKATGRKYVRISLGGVRDEAEIRGHRRTYIGSMPGRIIDSLKKAGTANPLILLDEIDKLSSDYRGDPSSALLEVLDPEQNFSFTDHYIDMPFDLSKVLFITTANDKAQIPHPLLDRMEVIELGSYTAEEKFHIARKHLIPKQIKLHGIKSSQMRITDKAIKTIIENYTREAGVRALEQQIAVICRKCASSIVKNGEDKITVKPEILDKYLGHAKFKSDLLSKENEIGVVNGLAWTAVGGEMLEVEVAVVDGTGKIELTGSLGDVMRESARTAITFLRSVTKEYDIENDFYKTKDIHIHFPEGAVPKDGPSAGITVSTALFSALTNTKVKKDVAMTGEISLRGRILPIGGLKEKSMAAFKSGIKTVIIPNANIPDLEDVDENIKSNINFIPVKFAYEAWDYAIEDFRVKNKKSTFESEIRLNTDRLGVTS
ncbi:MAG: endopeptidase La [Clostridiales bacterium]|nr:endopeptidase La [Clostridiales bacterium]